MRTRSKLLLSAFAATLALAALVSTASAGRLETSSQTWEAVWTPLTFGSEEGGGIEVRCSVTLRGTFHYRSIVKSVGALIGYVTDARVGHPCEGSGEAWALNGVERPRNGGTTLATAPNTLPWHVRYGGFTGNLPAITGVGLDLVAPKFVLNVFGLLCLYTNGTARGIANVDGTGRITGLRADETVGLAKQSGGFLCPGQGFFIGTGAVTNGSGASITIRLI